MKSVSLLLFAAVGFPSMMPNTAEARLIRFAVEQTRPFADGKSAVGEAARRSVKERLLLDEDAQRLIRIAEESSAMYL